MFNTNNTQTKQHTAKVKSKQNKAKLKPNKFKQMETIHKRIHSNETPAKAKLHIRNALSVKFTIKNITTNNSKKRSEQTVTASTTIK